MVNIVIVSHSRRLAEGVVELAVQMTRGRIKMAIAAGIDEPDNDKKNGLGTDVVAVMSAIEQVYSADGVLVLVDMGSAILSADMALELLGSEQAKAVYVCAAPLVEGSIAASVAAAAGMPIEQVIHEAHGALAAKYRQLNQTMPLPAEKPSAASLVAAPLSTDTRKAVIPQPAEQLQFSWQIQNPHGIHLRSAAAIVTAVSPFDADVWLSKGGQQINAKSINKITLLGLKHHDTVICITRGKEAGPALNAFRALAQRHFGEDLSGEDILREGMSGKNTVR
ncbi:dihydroxyacetone kinase phosphoryl donor subunit DhaM [Photobacterium sp.]|uniref:dihydroxyacetone kinase phosphoryl donor subunit DhaM n=1 Tax=Photobacterium sp. TaxID=660 RepID=UPI00299ED5FC|nr:dihydroxyacetone kinase phosphoryl donor subunit DhaM [Photobacterium sp.]MDX1303216.1 dihydroxyacetone kinase phosphoryl donor subunit DhaM [Photobacterium sp.]